VGLIVSLKAMAAREKFDAKSYPSARTATQCGLAGLSALKNKGASVCCLDFATRGSPEPGRDKSPRARDRPHYYDERLDGSYMIEIALVSAFST
jgi:hypothetical protein